jgi:hypothetical protein
LAPEQLFEYSIRMWLKPAGSRLKPVETGLSSKREAFIIVPAWGRLWAMVEIYFSQAVLQNGHCSRKKTIV